MRLFKAVLAIASLCLEVSQASAGTYDLKSTWIDIGIGPFQVQTGKAACLLSASDAQPVNNAGFAVYTESPNFQKIETTSRVWARAVNDSCFLATSSLAAVSIKDAALTAPAYCQVSVTTTAQSFAQLLSTASCPAMSSNARVAYVQPEGADIRWRDDGTAPTASSGRRIYSGTDYPIITAPLTNVQLIAITGTVTVNIDLYQ